MVFDGGIACACCCLGAASIYLLGRSMGRDAEFLKSATRVDQLKDLVHILDAATKEPPLVVAASGRVGSDTPINCEYSGFQGVIVKQTAEQHFLKQNDAGSWIRDSALMVSKCKEVPWYLDDTTARVHIVGARHATGLVLTAGSEVSEEPRTSDHLTGLKMLRVERIERLLPTGTPLTAVGEAFKDDTGAIRIRQPHKGPFYVCDQPIDQLIANLGTWSRLYKCASLGLTVFGVYLIGKHAVQCFTERRRDWEMRKRILAAAAAERDAKEKEGLSGEVDNTSHTSMRDQMKEDLCVICFEQECNAVFIPCGHMCCCMACSSRFTECPLCRTKDHQVVRTFRS